MLFSVTLRLLQQAPEVIPPWQTGKSEPGALLGEGLHVDELLPAAFDLQEHSRASMNEAEKWGEF